MPSTRQSLSYRAKYGLWTLILAAFGGFPGALTAQTTLAPPVTEIPATQTDSGSIASPPVREEDLRQLLLGKPMFLRGGYLDDTLNFSEAGTLTKSSPTGSFTLNSIQIEKVKLGKNKLELEGARYGLHFIGQDAFDDKSVERIRITPKKKVLRISIERAKDPKPHKEKDKSRNSPKDLSAPPTPTAAPVVSASQKLREALSTIFAPGLDEQMMAAMPDFWKLFYQAAAQKKPYRSPDPAVLRQSIVDQKATLLNNFEPASNEFAQVSGVAGIVHYQAVIGADGKAGEVVIAQPIGFGLDENAIAAIRKASFAPAKKAGKVVPVRLDVVLQFRIYSQRTAAVGATEGKGKVGSILPGPYSVQH